MLDQLPLLGQDGDEIFEECFEGFLNDFGWEDDAGSSDLHNRVVEEIKSSPSWRLKGSKVSMKRWFDTVQRGTRELHWWHARLYQNVLMALQMDQLTASSMSEAFRSKRRSTPSWSRAATRAVAIAFARTESVWS